jgi:hypothetical protein
MILLSTIAVVRAGAASERFYTLIVENRRVGYSHYRSEATSEGLKTTSDTLIRVSLLGTPSDLSYQSVALYTPDGKRPLRYTLTFRRGQDESTVDCHFKADSVEVAATVAGATQKKTLPWKGGTYLVEGNCIETWHALFRALGVDASSREIHLFTPLGGSIQPARFKRGKPVNVQNGGKKRMCSLYTLGSGAGGVEILVAQDTRVVVEFRVPAQKAVFRLADRAAMQGIQNFEALTRAFALTDAKFGDPSALNFVKLKVTAEIVGEKITAASLQSPTQKFTGTVRNGRVEGILEVKPFHYEGRNALPFTGKPSADPRVAAYLKPEPNIESDDPEIAALAKKLTEGAGTQWDAAKRIGEWVHKNIAYSITGTGAKQCLASKKGDCGPHTWLTIALYRAAGIPARITGGALYSRALGGSFGQHYWTRVWMGPDGWIPIDTTTGEVGALSPLHLTFWNLGGIGSLSVKVLDYAPKPAVVNTAPNPLPRSPLNVAQGEKERYVFRMDGKGIGEQTAECARADATGSAWKFAIRLNVAGQGAPVKVSMEGTFSLNERAGPTALSLDADVNGAKQKVSYTFQPTRVLVTMNIGGREIRRESARDGAEFLQMNNLLTPLSLATRVLRIAPGQKVATSFFAAGAQQKLDMTFAALPKTETIKIGGREVDCVVCDVSPIANRFYLARDTGELMRVTVEAQKIVIEREE